MRTAFVVVLISACGGASKRAAPAPAPIATPVLSVAATSCADAGELLRGPVDDEENHAKGPSRAAAIANACDQGKWSSAILHCIGDEADPTTCLAKLTDVQRALYDGKLVAWAEAFEEPPLPDDGADAYVDCGDAIRNVAGFAPELTVTGEALELALAMRRREVAAQCNAQGWDMAVRACLSNATDPAPVATCAATLTPDQRAALGARLAEIDALVAKTLAKRNKPADCKQLVAVHYADAAWKNKLATVPAAERRKAIAESRKRMVNTCVAEAWDPTLRACVQADGGDLCFPEAEYAWGFPAAGVMPTLTGSTECDEYFVALTKAQACSKIPEGTRDALAEGAKAMRQALDAVKNPDADTRRSFGTACRAGSDAVQQMLTSMGC